MNAKSIKRALRAAAVITVPVAAALVASIAPASAAVGDYTTKTYISWDYKVTDDGNGGTTHVNGKLPVESAKNGTADDPIKAPSEIGAYYKNDDFKVGYTHDIAKDQDTLSGSVYGDNGSAVNGSYTADTNGNPAKGELSYTTPKASDGSTDQFGVKQNFDDPTTATKDESSTTLYAEEKSKEGDKLGVSYNVTNGDVSVYVEDTEPIVKTDNATASEVTQYSYVVADTNPNKA